MWIKYTSLLRPWNARTLYINLIPASKFISDVLKIIALTSYKAIIGLNNMIQLSIVFLYSSNSVPKIIIAKIKKTLKFWLAIF